MPTSSQHVRRADYFWNLIQTAVETLFFFHPAVWWLGGRLRQQRELCCDDAAVQACSDPLIYATALLASRRAAQPAAEFGHGSGWTPVCLCDFAPASHACWVKPTASNDRVISSLTAGRDRRSVPARPGLTGPHLFAGLRSTMPVETAPSQRLFPRRLSRAPVPAATRRCWPMHATESPS